jgi:hypothetical protein
MAFTIKEETGNKNCYQAVYIARAFKIYQGHYG